MSLSDSLERDETHILVVDDDAQMRRLLQSYLHREGFRVTTVENADDARARLGGLLFDLLIVDVMMPGQSGVEFTAQLRQSNDVPILMLTAMGEAGARIAGLEAGADDYLAKPFEPRELVLRIQSLLRRKLAAAPALAKDKLVRLGRYHFDLQRQLLLLGDEALRLTSAETALLSVMGAAPGQVFDRMQLTDLARIDGGERAVDVQVTRLRKKIEQDPRNPRYLQTVRGQGYVLMPD